MIEEGVMSSDGPSCPLHRSDHSEPATDSAVHRRSSLRFPLRRMGTGHGAEGHPLLIQIKRWGCPSRNLGYGRALQTSFPMSTLQRTLLAVIVALISLGAI